jgi:hypothetical protein
MLTIVVAEGARVIGAGHLRIVEVYNCHGVSTSGDNI